MARYLVTGAAGFIGSKVAELLLAEGHDVVGLDNLNDAYDVRLKDWRLAQLASRDGFAFQRADITDRAALLALFEAQPSPFAAIFNLAARAGVRSSVSDPWLYYDTNLTGTLNLLDLAVRHEVPKFILASTSSIYGDSAVMPCQETQQTSLPLSPYTASKKAAETLCHTYHYLHGLDVTIFRYFTVYGPAGRPDMSLFRFVKWVSEGQPVQIFGDGTQSRDFTYVDDIARGTIAGRKPLGYEIINLGSDTPIVLNAALGLVEELVGRRATRLFDERHPADTPASWADIGKAERLLGWRPQLSFEEGVARLVAWYQANHDWAKDIET